MFMHPTGWRHFVSSGARWSADCSGRSVINRKPFLFQHSVFAGALFGTALTFSFGAETSISAAKTPDDITMLGRFEVSGVPIEQQILPTSRPFNSVFGTDDNIIDVPRNVTIISRQQLSDISITDVLDFSKLTSSAFTTTNFGAPSNASIRGQSSDSY